MAPEKPPPLPLAENRAALSNRISLLLASQSSVLKTMKQSTTLSNARTATTQGHHHHGPEEENLFREGTRPNEGVGYVGDKAKKESDAVAKEDRMLRGKLLGNRKAAEEKKRRIQEEDEEDEEEGRSSLGKRKRPKRTREPVEEEEDIPETVRAAEEPTAVQDQDIQAAEKAQMTETDQNMDVEPTIVPDDDGAAEKSSGKKRKKKKNKNKNKKQQQLQEA